jgi:hypothetical protein
MQGVLAQAKNGDELWEDKFHAANGKPQACHQSALLFFLLSFGGGRGGEGESEGFFFIFPWFPMCSHYCPFKFPMGSQYAPQLSNVFPNMFSIALVTFIPYALANGVLLSPIYMGQKGGTLYFKIEPSILGNLHNFFFSLVMVQSNWLIAKRKKIELKRHLI